MRRGVLFVFGCVLLAGLVWYAGLGPVERALALLGIHGIAFLALIHLPVLVLLGLAWWYSSERLAPPFVFIAGRLVREAAADLLPFSQLGGIAAGLRMTALKGVALLSAAASLFADLIAELAAKLPYAAAGLILLVVLAPGTGLMLPLSLGFATLSGGLAAIVIFKEPLTARVTRAAETMIARWTKQRLDPGVLVAAFARDRFLPSLALHVVSWFWGAVECWVIFFLMDMPVSPGHAIVIDSLASSLRTFGFFIPAAAGIQEGAYIAVCALFGIAPSTALAFSLARRAREIALGVLGLALWQLMEFLVIKQIARRPQPPG